MKETRIEFRSSPEEKELLSFAAQLKGVNVSALLREAALQFANEIIQEHEKIKLSKKDQDLFLQALENPPEPSEVLIKAMNKYRNSKVK